jgi:hypothetical protein
MSDKWELAGLGIDTGIDSYILMGTMNDTTQNAQLWQYFKDEGITPKDVAERTGYALAYVYHLIQGFAPLNDKARFRMIQAFPDTADLLLNGNQSARDDLPEGVPT